MTNDQQKSSGGAELERVAALLRLASHRCGHEVELTFDPQVLAAAQGSAEVAWVREDAEAGPTFRAAAPIVCDGRCVAALAASGVGAPDNGLAEVVALAAAAAGRLIRPLTWRMLKVSADSERVCTAA